MTCRLLLPRSGHNIKCKKCDLRQKGRLPKSEHSPEFDYKVVLTSSGRKRELVSKAFRKQTISLPCLSGQPRTSRCPAVLYAHPSGHQSAFAALWARSLGRGLSAAPPSGTSTHSTLGRSRATEQTKCEVPFIFVLSDIICLISLAALKTFSLLL